METVYYTLAARRMTVMDARAAGDEGMRRVVCLPRRNESAAPGAGKVIQMGDWLREHREEEEPCQEVETVPAQAPAVAPAVSHRLIGAEWVATLSVIGVMVLLALRILAA